MKKVTQPSPVGEGAEMDTSGHDDGAPVVKAAPKAAAPKADKK